MQRQPAPPVAGASAAATTTTSTPPDEQQQEQQQPPPPTFLNLEELSSLARTRMEKSAYDYFAGGSETQTTLADNTGVFAEYRILPRILVDVSRVDTSASFFGFRARLPVWVAPMAMHGLAHADAEVGTARGAAAAGAPMVVSTMANTALEDVPPASGHPCLLFQLYVIRDRALVAAWVAAAEAAGYKALVVTVDAQRLGRREADERNRFCLPDHLQLANLLPLAAKKQQQQEQQQAQQHGDDTAAAGGHSAVTDAEQLLQARPTSEGSGLFQLFAKEVDDSLDWGCIAWLRSVTSLPIYVKGVLAPGDARIAVDLGVDGIIVSNHGGRQLDYAPTALDMLPAIAAEVAGRVPVLIDGGVRRGTDVLKALALGASGVLLGRPVLFGLAVGGADGVQRALELLQQELELAMALSGCVTLADIGPHLLLQKANTGLVPVVAQRES